MANTILGLVMKWVSEDRITAAKQHNGLPYRGEKQKHQCHYQQHINTRSGKETRYDVALEDSLGVSEVRSTFPCSLTREHTTSPLPQWEAAPLWQPAMSLGKCPANSFATLRQLLENL